MLMKGSSSSSSNRGDPIMLVGDGISKFVKRNNNDDNSCSGDSSSKINNRKSGLWL